jgi:phosphohistidine phosphatase
LPDHDRPLNGRGNRSRALIAEHVRGWPVDLVVCSTAVRARATAEPVIEALGCPVQYEQVIYDEGVYGMLDLLRQLPDSLGAALFVGHNPGMEQLTSTLTGAHVRYPTAALGTIELQVDRWADASAVCGTLTAHITPADLAD